MFFFLPERYFNNQVHTAFTRWLEGDTNKDK